MPLATSVMATTFATAVGGRPSTAATLLETEARKPGCAATEAGVRAAAEHARVMLKATSTSGTLVTEGVCDGVGVLVGVMVCDGVGVEVGDSEVVDEGVTLAVKLAVLVVEIVGVAVDEGDGVSDGVGVGVMLGVGLGLGAISQVCVGPEP